MGDREAARFVGTGSGGPLDPTPGRRYDSPP